MESHKIWIANLNDLLTNHICQGLLKTYAEILRLCGGHKLKLSIQTAMEGISHLSSHKINSDYKVLLESLNRIGYTDINLNDLITNAYSSYALSALRSAGIKCERLDVSLLNGPKQGAFIHEVYINVARNLWTRPDVLIDQNVPQLKIYVKESIEQAIRSGVNLNYITSALAAGADKPAPAPPSVSQQTLSLTIKEHLNTLNGSKSILDDEDSDDLISDDETANIQATIKPMPAAPSMLGEMTIENDDLAPDNMTITDSSLQVNASLPPLSIGSGSKKEDEMIINVRHRGDIPFDIDNTSSYTVDDTENDDEDDEDVDDDDTDTVTLTSTKDAASKSSHQSSKPSNHHSTKSSHHSSKHSSKPSHPPSKPSHHSSKQEVDMLTDTDSIPSFLVAGEIKLEESKRPKKKDDETNSTYTVTLLSHRDMLSSRLSKLGF